jgi:hypothetical protein
MEVSKPTNWIDIHQLFTKQKFQMGLKCNQLLWQEFHSPEKEKKYSNQNYYRNNLQTEVLLELIKEKFSSFEIIPHNKDLIETVELTNLKIKNSLGLIHPCFLVENFFTKIDIIKINPDNSLEIYDIKNSINLKREHYLNLLFQKYILEKLDFHIKDILVIQVNEKYEYIDELKIDEFFKIKSVFTKLSNYEKDFFSILKNFYELKESQTRPRINEESSCSSPKTCLLKTCWNLKEEIDIYDLREGKMISDELFKKEIYFLKDIPDSTELNWFQKIQVDCSKKKEDFIDHQKINNFLQSLIYPIYYLDFETINPIVPIYKNTKPYLHVPFLFSLYIQREQDSNLEHYTFIDDLESDPREKILELLSSLILPDGSILCYNDIFEKRCIRESVEIFPKFKNWFDGIVNNFIDLSIPFRNFYFYSSKQKGSVSLKSILPALTDKNHKELEISDGNTANLEFLKIKLNKIKNTEAEIVKKRLIDYCNLDSYAMYEIIKALELKTKT